MWPTTGGNLDARLAVAISCPVQIDTNPGSDPESAGRLRRNTRHWMAFNKHRSPLLFARFKRLCNKGIKVARETNLKYELAIANEASKNKKRYFGYAQARSTSRKVTGNALHINGQLLNTDKDIADSFLASFQQVFRLDSLSNYPTLDRVSDMPDLAISTPDVERVFKTLKISKSAGPDNIHPAVIKPIESLMIPQLVTGTRPVRTLARGLNL
ncbi:unnamed protein product [Echinostoma caproni]|uniref:Reverse transcriptase domain-containing protein n=1 Tax=Echinostoma caproni TaxID=27848 RepID=A0A183BEE6_9TREM|nr:unnamed protein product [Echinostoma caproni]